MIPLIYVIQLHTVFGCADQFSDSYEYLSFRLICRDVAFTGCRGCVLLAISYHTRPTLHVDIFVTSTRNFPIDISIYIHGFFSSFRILYLRICTHMGVTNLTGTPKLIY